MGKKGVFEGATNSLILGALALDSNKREIVESPSNNTAKLR